MGKRSNKLSFFFLTQFLHVHYPKNAFLCVDFSSLLDWGIEEWSSPIWMPVLLIQHVSGDILIWIKHFKYSSYIVFRFYFIWIAQVYLHLLPSNSGLWFLVLLLISQEIIQILLLKYKLDNLALSYIRYSTLQGLKVWEW